MDEFYQTPKKPASRTCATVGPPEYSDGPEPDFWTIFREADSPISCCSGLLTAWGFHTTNVFQQSFRAADKPGASVEEIDGREQSPYYQAFLSLRSGMIDKTVSHYRILEKLSILRDHPAAVLFPQSSA